MVTEEDNAIIERMVEEGKSAMAIRSAVPNVSRTNVYLKIAKYKKHGTVGRVQTKTLGRPRVMDEGIDKFLQGLLAAKPGMELEEMRRHLQDRLHITVSMSTISRAISRSGVAAGRPNRTRNSPRRRNRKAAITIPLDQDHDQDHEHDRDAPGAVVFDTAAQSSPTGAGQDNGTANLAGPHLRDGDDEQGVWDDAARSTTTLNPQQRQQQQHRKTRRRDPREPQPQQQQHDLDVLDPSLAQAYPTSTPYPGVYAHNLAAAGPAVLTSPAGFDAYKSPYAPV